LSASPTSPDIFDEAAWTLTRNIGDPRFNPQLRNDGTLFGATGLTGDAFGLFTGTVTFQFGVPTLLAVTLAGTAEGSVGRPECVI
jgi:hypothetical protein